MSASVKLVEEDQKKLERLQAKLTLGLGERPNLQDTLGTLKGKALEDDGLLDSVNRWRPGPDGGALSSMRNSKAWARSGSSSRTGAGIRHLSGA